MTGCAPISCPSLAASDIALLSAYMFKGWIRGWKELKHDQQSLAKSQAFVSPYFYSAINRLCKQ